MQWWWCVRPWAAVWSLQRPCLVLYSMRHKPHMGPFQTLRVTAHFRFVNQCLACRRICSCCKPHLSVLLEILLRCCCKVHISLLVIEGKNCVICDAENKMFNEGQSIFICPRCALLDEYADTGLHRMLYGHLLIIWSPILSQLQNGRYQPPRLCSCS